MTAFIHFVFVVTGFSALFHLIDVTDPTTMRGQRTMLKTALAYESIVLLWAAWLMWGDV